MGLRDSANRHRGASALAAALLLSTAIFLVVRQLRAPDERQSEQAFYTTDEGATRFVGSMELVPPFMYKGQWAVRAWYYTCDDGKTDFVGYLEKYTDAAKTELERLKKNPKARRQAMLDHLGAGGLLVKKPGDRWVTFTEDEYADTITPVCPDGDPQKLKRVIP